MALRPLQVLERPGSKRAVGRAPAPHEDEPRVDVVGRLAAGALVVGLGAVGLVHREHLGLGRDVRPELGAPAEQVEQPLNARAAVQHRGAAGPRAVEDGRRSPGVADAQELLRDLVERLVPGDPLEAARAAWPRTPQRVAQPIRVVHALELAKAPHAGVERRQLGCPPAGVRADLDDPPVTHVSVDDTPAAAVVAAGAGGNRLARSGRDPRRLVDDPGTIHADLLPSSRDWNGATLSSFVRRTNQLSRPGSA